MARFPLPFLAFGFCSIVLFAAGTARAQSVKQPVGVEACAPCHGMDGIAKDVEVPHLAGQNVVYLLNQMKAFRSGERKHKEMRWMSRHMTRDELEALAIYYASLPRI